MGSGASVFTRSSAHGIPVACGSRRCPQSDCMGRRTALPQEDAEMKPIWLSVGSAGLAPDRVATPLTPTRGDRAPSPEPSVDEEPHDDA